MSRYLDHPAGQGTRRFARAHIRTDPSPGVTARPHRRPTPGSGRCSRRPGHGWCLPEGHRQPEFAGAAQRRTTIRVRASVIRSDRQPRQIRHRSVSPRPVRARSRLVISPDLGWARSSADLAPPMSADGHARAAREQQSCGPKSEGDLDHLHDADMRGVAWEAGALAGIGRGECRAVFLRQCCARGSECRAVRGGHRMCAGVGWVASFRSPVVVSAGGDEGRAGLLAGR